MKRSIPAVLLLAACHGVTPAPAPQSTPAAAPPAASAPQPVSASVLEDHEGDSIQTAVMVPADAPNAGADFENQWIFDRYGRFKRYGSGTGSVEGRRYNVVKIELANGDRKQIFFDITENWARELGGQASPPVPQR